MTLLYTNPCFLDHETGNHPEKPARLARISEHLKTTALDTACVRPTWSPASLERLNRLHDPKYVAAVEEYARKGGGRIESDTVVSPKSYDVARQAAGAVCDAVERVVRGEDSRALCLVRPPGHHALKAEAMGFCLFNNVAIGARVAVDELDLERVLIVDWDVHHGNGTQDAFWSDGQVGFISIHRSPFYPGTGDREETGTGKGLGMILNLPTRFGTSRSDYRSAFTNAISTFADKVRPQLIIVSAGFDTHRLDPIGSLGLETEDFTELTQNVVQIADAHAKGRIVSVLEGGYNIEVLPHCVEAHLRALMPKMKS